MLKKLLSFLLSAACLLNGLALAEAAPQSSPALADGVYSAEFTTDSSMFRVNETLDNRGTLTVANGEMMIHVTLNSKKILNLFPGLAEDAKREGAILLQPTEDKVTYPDGWVETVYGFDIPVPALEEEFDLALIGTKGKWYDHKVMVSHPEPMTPPRDIIAPDSFSFSGGSGRVTITCQQVWMEDGQAMAAVAFSSPHYAWVKVDGVEYPCAHDEARSTAEIPVNMNRATAITAQTTAMSQPHEVAYTLYIGLSGEAREIDGLTWQSSLPLSYAEGFSIDFYEGGYALIDVKDSARYLAVPEDMPVPEGLDPAVIVLQKPLDHIYMAASAVMSLFDALNALDAVRLSATAQDGWYVENAAGAMARGDILFAGKYSEPDFELLVREQCDLAVESMMITHAPQVKELIELLKIPVFIDRSSYEPHPLGRVEWIRLYGALLDKQAEADEAFARQARLVESLQASSGDRPAVAFFALKPDGTVTVRGPKDYIARSIELAGGRYVFEVAEGQEANAAVSVTMEAFYEAAADADFIIYNAAIEEPVEDVEALLKKQPLFADFRAVKEGNVWCASRSLYQATDRVGTFIDDLRRVFAGEEDDLTFLEKISE